MEAITCPQCNAPLAPHRFARSMVCPYCGVAVQLDEASVSAVGFREALRAWNAPATYGVASWVSVGESHWALDRQIAYGDISDVYAGRRARWPTELAIIKLLRDRKDESLFENEWQSLQRLQRSNAPGADTFTALLPQPILHGDLSYGANAGARVNIYRWVGGFRHTFEQVIEAYPQGIPPRASLWVWRRMLEMLSFIHTSGMAHGAVLPSHVLVQDNDHGVRLVGYSAAGPLSEGLRTVSERFKSFYPQSAHPLALTAQLDFVMSARCIVALLGGDPASGSLPATVPPPLADIVRRIALGDPAAPARQDAWALREELGEIAKKVFGPPQFNPIVMPS
jgi:hypothetical protein